MRYPLLNISTTKWDSDFIEYVIYDKYIYTNDDAFFSKFYKGQFFCDSDGKIFKAIRKAPIKEKWRNWLRFLPNVWKVEIIFEATNSEMSVKELKDYLLARISDVNKDENLKGYSSLIKNAKTHIEVIDGR